MQTASLLHAIIFTNSCLHICTVSLENIPVCLKKWHVCVRTCPGKRTRNHSWRSCPWFPYCAPESWRFRGSLWCISAVGLVEVAIFIVTIFTEFTKYWPELQQSLELSRSQGAEAPWGARAARGEAQLGRGAGACGGRRCVCLSLRPCPEACAAVALLKFRWCCRNAEMLIQCREGMSAGENMDTFSRSLSSCHADVHQLKVTASLGLGSGRR